MRNRIRRGVTITVAAVVAAATFFAAPAVADTAAIRDAEAKLAAIKENASRIDADYATAQAAVEEAEVKLKQVDADIVTQTAKLDGLRASLGQLAIMQYQNNGIDMTTQLLTSSDESSFLNQLATLTTVTQRTNSNVQDVQVEQAKLERLQADAHDYKAKMAAARDKQAALVKEFDDKEAEAQRILNSLKAEERARIEAAQRAEADSATQRANQQASTSAPKTVVGGGDWGSAPGSERALAAVNFARTQLGKPYVFGSTGPGGYDCSGLTTAAYGSVGIQLPRTSYTQWRVGTPVSKGDLRPGDLLFFYGGISHVGLYAGNGVMIHSAPSGRGVFYSNLSTYPSYQGARRVVG